MQCPDPQSIEELLRDDGYFEPQLIEHVRGCSVCQQRLDRIADDPELRRWRSSLLSHSLVASPSSACRDLIERFRSKETPSEKPASHSTASEPGLAPPTPALETGSVIDHYRVVRELGRGGMSVVLEAVDTRIDRTVALKLMQATANYDRARARFVREATAVASIRHPNVITVYEAEYPDNALPYMVMELVRGETLRTWIARGDGFNPRISADIVAQVADGLQAAHQAGVLHRDIKPSNILLAKLDVTQSKTKGTESTLQPKLADFGLTRPIAPEIDLTQSGFMAGTPAYASPEQILTPDLVDQRSDLYSLGVTLYESLTGTVPFRGSSQAVLQQIVEGEFVPPRRLNPAIAHDLETVCLKAMSHAVGNRYATAAEFGADLRRWLSGEPIHARRSSAFEKLWRWVIRNPRVAALATSTAVLLMLLAGGSLAAALLINSKNDELQREAEKSRLASISSERFAISAIEQRELAITSLNDLINKVQVQLTDQPGTLKLREDLLRTAFAGLERVAESADQTGLEHSTIEAHHQMSKILTALGDATGAMNQVHKAAELCERAVAENPEDLEFQRNLASTLALEASLYREAFAFDKIQPILERVLELRQSIAARQPEDFAAQRDLLVCKQQLADVALRRSEYTAALDGFESTLKSVVQLQERFPDRQELARDQCVLQNRMASILLQLNRLPEADSLLNKSAERTESLIANAPDNTTYQTDLGSTLSRLARLKLATYELEAALKFANRAKEQYAAVALRNPDDVAAQSLVGNVTYLLFEVLLAMGQLEEARVAAEASAQIQIQLNEQHPGSAKPLYLAEEATAAAGGMYFRQGDLPNALVMQKRSCELLYLVSQTKDFSPSGPYAKNLDRSTSLARALALCIAGEKTIDEAMAVEPTSAKMAIALQACELARRGEIESMLTRAEQLRDLSPVNESDQYWMLYPLARAYGIAVSKLNPTGSTDEDNSRLRATQDLCLDALARLLKVSPQHRDLLRSEIDFAAIRQTKAFQDLLTVTQ